MVQVAYMQLDADQQMEFVDVFLMEFAAYSSFQAFKGLAVESVEQEWDRLDCDSKCEWIPNQGNYNLRMWQQNLFVAVDKLDPTHVDPVRAESAEKEIGSDCSLLHD